MTEPTPQNPFSAGQRTSRLRTIILVSAGIILVAFLVLFYARSRRSGIIVTGPIKEFTVTLNGRSVTTQETSKGLYIPVYSGVYRLKVDRQNYLPFTYDVSVPAGKQVLIRPIFTLIPSSSETAQNGIDYVRPSPDQKALYYLGSGRQYLYRMEIANQAHIRLSDHPLHTVSDVQWSNDPTVALVVETDGVYMNEIVKFDFETQALVKIGGREIISPKWDPKNSQRFAAAYFTAAGEHSLVMANRAFTQVDRLADLSAFTNPQLVWSEDGRFIAVINHSAKAADNNVWVYSVQNATFQQATTSGNVLNADFSPSGNVLLYERLPTPGETGERVLIGHNTNTGSEQTLPFSGDLSRLAWKDDGHLYAIAPSNQHLVLLGWDGSSVDESYVFPTDQDVRGLFYFSSAATLIYYTDNAVYTIGLDH